jgi:hypothetical protein
LGRADRKGLFPGRQARGDPETNRLRNRLRQLHGVPVSSYALPSLWKCYHELPHHVRKLADKNFALFKENPQHQSSFRRRDYRKTNQLIHRLSPAEEQTHQKQAQPNVIRIFFIRMRNQGIRLRCLEIYSLMIRKSPSCSRVPASDCSSVKALNRQDESGRTEAEIAID